MGKVQDTISRFNQRRMHQAPAGIALIIPSQQKPTSDSFPTSHAAVSNWLSTQSSTDPDVFVASLITALQHSNRLQNSPGERIKIMDLFKVRLQQALPQLNAQFLGMDFPYSNRAQIAFEQASTLLQELSYGYKIALADALLGRGRLNQKSRVHAIFQAMFAIGECGLRHAQSYCSWPDKSWRDINTLYLLAESEKATAGADLRHPGTTQTVHQLPSYTHHLAHLMSVKVNTCVPCKWIPCSAPSAGTAIPFNCTVKGRDSADLFSVALNSAHPPAADKFSLYEAHNTIRYFSLNALHDEMLITADSEQTHSALSRAMLLKLKRIWARDSLRNDARAIRHQPFFTQIGLKEIAASLKPESADLSSDQMTDTFGNEWTLVNESANGIGLCAPKHLTSHIAVGALMAWEPDSFSALNHSCHIGLVRWINNDNSELLNVGVETISHTAQPVTVARADSKYSTASANIDGLFFIEPDTNCNQIILLVPPGQFKLGELVTMRTANAGLAGDQQLKLAQRIDVTGSVDCFAVNKRCADSEKKSPDTGRRWHKPLA